MSQFLPETNNRDTGYLKKPISQAGKLTADERRQWVRYNASVHDLTPEFKAWLTNFLLIEFSGALGTGPGGTGPGISGATQGHVIQEEGASVEQRGVLNFIGDGVTVTDDGSSKTLVTFESVDPAEATQVWMPLTTVVAGVPELVWDDDDSLVPTLVPA